MNIAEASDARVGGRRNSWKPGPATSLRLALRDLNCGNASSRNISLVFPPRATTQFSNMNFTRESKGAYDHEGGYVVGERNTVVRYKNSNQVGEIGPVSVVEAE